MKFAAKIRYIQDTDKIQSIRPAHRAYLTGLLKEGKIAATGPFTDNYGALIVYEATDMAQAEEFIRNDPFNIGGIFVEWEVHPWNVVMANKDLFPA